MQISFLIESVFLDELLQVLKYAQNMSGFTISSSQNKNWTNTSSRPELENVSHHSPKEVVKKGLFTGPLLLGPPATPPPLIVKA